MRANMCGHAVQAALESSACGRFGGVPDIVIAPEYFIGLPFGPFVNMKSTHFVHHIAIVSRPLA